jgi:hypothetical protein
MRKMQPWVLGVHLNFFLHSWVPNIIGNTPIFLLYLWKIFFYMLMGFCYLYVLWLWCKMQRWVLGLHFGIFLHRWVPNIIRNTPKFLLHLWKIIFHMLLRFCHLYVFWLGIAMCAKCSHESRDSILGFFLHRWVPNIIRNTPIFLLHLWKIFFHRLLRFC